jgi:hypothetical protein
MYDDQFDQNFVWYEWSFVAPADVPTDDLNAQSARRGVSHTPAVPHAPGRSDVMAYQAHWQERPIADI